MNQRKLESAVRMGLEMASGKPLDQAVKAVMQCLELVLDLQEIQKGQVEALESQPKPTYVGRVATPPASPDANPEPLHDLAPIGDPGPATSKPKTRVYWQQEDITQKLLDETPPSFEVTPEGHPQPLVLHRSIGIQPGDIVGVQLGYRPAGGGNDVPFPKRTYWTSDEEIVVNGAVEKLKAEAVLMYRLRSTPVVPRPVPEIPLRFNIGGEVS